MQGSHTAMKSGMLAAEALYTELESLPSFSEEEADVGSAPIEVMWLSWLNYHGWDCRLIFCCSPWFSHFLLNHYRSWLMTQPLESPGSGRSFTLYVILMQPSTTAPYWACYTQLSVGKCTRFSIIDMQKFDGPPMKPFIAAIWRILFIWLYFLSLTASSQEAGSPGHSLTAHLTHRRPNLQSFFLR